MKIVRGNSLEFIPASHEDSQNPGVLKKVLATRNDLIAGRVQMVLIESHLPVEVPISAALPRLTCRKCL